MPYAQAIHDLIKETYIIILQSTAQTLETAQDLLAFMQNFEQLSPQGQAAQAYLITNLFQMVTQNIQETRDHLITQYEQTLPHISNRD